MTDKWTKDQFNQQPYGRAMCINNSSSLQQAHTRAVQEVSVHFDYLENRSRGLDVTWQPVGEDLTVHL